MTRRPLRGDEREFLVQLGETIRDARKERGLNQDQLGEVAGIRGTRIGEIENGVVDTSITRVRAIAHGLQLTPSALLRRQEMAAQDAHIVQAARAGLHATVERLSPREIDVLTEVAAALLLRRR